MSKNFSHMWDTNPKNGKIPFQLDNFITNVIKKNGLIINEEPYRESENTDYGAVIFFIENKKIMFRVAKTTPSKEGQFVALYKRCHTTDKIVPIDIHDSFDYLFIACCDQDNYGIFIFSKDILLRQGICSQPALKGKLSFRVYAPWVTTTSIQAGKTQKWQHKYYLSFNNYQSSNDFDNSDKIFLNHLKYCLNKID